MTGEIRNAFINTKYSLEFNSDCLLEWHAILDVEYDKKLLELIPKEDNMRYTERNTITIYFDGFLHLPYSRISLKTNLFPTFQNFLDYIYGLIKNEVNLLSYGKEWILFNTVNGIILDKDNLKGSRSLNEMKINNAEKIICYKK